MQEGATNPSRDFWCGRRVVVIGNTGFKGTWLSLWLHRLGATVVGVSLPPPTDPSLHALAHLAKLVPTVHSDIRDFHAVQAVLDELKPEIVFHLAAQALVRLSYRLPLETYATNVMGTAHVLEAIRLLPSVRSVVIVTSDKCYEDRQWPWAYRETDAMGGFDPYSSSKACAELVTAAYRRSFLDRVGIATARAGNVIGGGDWAPDRLLPDCMRALAAGEPIAIRHPEAIRPWQHVLEPLDGYLLLAEHLALDGADFSDAWNFGPADADARPVGWIADRIVEQWGDGATWCHNPGDAAHETTSLKVDASRARMRLGWAPRLSLQHALCWTIEWHRRLTDGEPALALMDEQLSRYGAMGRTRP
jgi:CDP-glucose 4,6-dehydratase